MGKAIRHCSAQFKEILLLYTRWAVFVQQLVNYTDTPSSGYTQLVERAGSILQMNEELNVRKPQRFQRQY